jgi:uncharacterized protein involved in response to NO
VDSGARLPPQWQEAFRRDRKRPKPLVADPLPERRLARLLGAFIATGLFFLVFPGTLLGVWNLINISSRHQAESVPAAWLQAHGHAQFFGWVGAFAMGICLYTVPKFRGGAIRSLRLGWGMWVLWTGAVLVRWGVGIWPWHWRPILICSAVTELLVALLLYWHVSASGRSRPRMELWNRLVFVGLTGFVAVMSVQLAMVASLHNAPVIPLEQNRLFLWFALWSFAFPVVCGFSARFLPSFLGLQRPDEESAYASLAALGIANLMAVAGWNRATVAMILITVLLGCWSLRIFHPARRSPKVAGVDPRYPWFVRIAFVWLLLSALLPLGGDSAGWLGASRHAFTVGFLATLIFAIGPRILPAFLNSRELWSKRLMLVAPVLLTAGCILRVVFEPLAYGETAPAAWQLLPVSAILELIAVLVFAYNIGRTLATPVPTWIDVSTIDQDLALYWCVASYPKTRRLLERAGLKTLRHAEAIPWSLTLREAAEADGVDWHPLVALLKEYFEHHLARALRAS